MSRFNERIPIRKKNTGLVANKKNLYSRDFLIWGCVILFLITLATFSWIASISIFSHPEKPLNYSILTKLKKIEPPKNFEMDDAPRGEFTTPEKILEKYASLSKSELKSVNALLQRNFIRNYKLSPMLVPYITGEFIIMDSNELAAGQYFESGVAALAVSITNPNLILEHIFPARDKVVPILHRALLTGTKITFSRKTDISAILNIQQLEDGKLLVTTIPISYGSYTSTQIKESVSLTPPSNLNVAAGLPIHNTKMVTEAQKKYSQYVERKQLPSLVASETSSTPTSQLIRVQSPIVGPNISAPNLKQEVVEQNQPTSLPNSASSPSPQPSLLSQNSSLQVFTPEASPSTNVSQPPPQPTPASSPAFKWKTYRSGMMPRGRLFEPKDLEKFAGNDFSRENVYLRGRFIVTAAGPNRAVLRSEASLAESLGLRTKSSNIRIIADFPPGQRPPPEGSSFSRDALRPFQIVKIQRGKDGQINVFVREITQP